MTNATQLRPYQAASLAKMRRAIASARDNAALNYANHIGYSDVEPYEVVRSGCRPLSDLDAVLAMGMAARFHKTPSALRAVMQRISTRAENPAIRQIIRLSATSHDPHAIAWDAVHRCG